MSARRTDSRSQDCWSWARAHRQPRTALSWSRQGEGRMDPPGGCTTPLSTCVSRCFDQGELLGAPVSLFHIPKYLVSTYYVQSSSGPCRYSMSRQSLPLLTCRIVSGSDKCSLPSRPCTISLLSLPPIIALPNWSGHRVVDTQGYI